MPNDMYHEPPEELTTEVRDMSRAIQTLIEELEACLWYFQRISVATDEKLKEEIQHALDEEKEHAAKMLRWILDRDKVFRDAIEKELK